MRGQTLRVEFADEDWKRLYTEASFRMPRLGTDIVRTYRKKVTLLQAVSDQQELRQHKSLRLEKLKGDKAGLHSIRLNDQWRLLLQFETDATGQLVIVIKVDDYH